MINAAAVTSAAATKTAVICEKDMINIRVMLNVIMGE